MTVPDCPHTKSILSGTERILRSEVEECGPCASIGEPVLLLSSQNSTYGAQVLRAAAQHGLAISRVVVERAPARGGLQRFWSYRRRYGWAAALFRAFEDQLFRLVRTCKETTSRSGRSFTEPGTVGDRPKRELILLRAIRVLRGHSARETVEQAAVDLGIPLEEVPSLNHPQARQSIAQQRSPLALLGGTRILSAATLALFPAGVLNAHPGLLPEYRGNYPNRWALLHGDEPGITVYLLDAGIDTGAILLRRAVPRRPGEGLFDFEERVTALCAALVVQTAHQYLQGQITPQDQNLIQGHTYGLMPPAQTLALYRRLRRQDRYSRDADSDR